MTFNQIHGDGVPWYPNDGVARLQTCIETTQRQRCSIFLLPCPNHDVVFWAQGVDRESLIENYCQSRFGLHNP
jgi:hypothetical protein